MGDFMDRLREKAADGGGGEQGSGFMDRLRARAHTFKVEQERAEQAAEEAIRKVRSSTGLFGDMPAPPPGALPAALPEDDKPWWFIGPTDLGGKPPADPYGMERIGTDQELPALMMAGEEATSRAADALVRGLEAGIEQTKTGAGQIGLGMMKRDPSLMGRGALKTTAGALSTGVQALPPVAAMSGTAGSLAELMGEEEAAGRELPTGVETLNLPNKAFEGFDELVGGNIAEWTGNEDAGQIGTLLATGLLFGGLSKGEAAVRGRLPSSVPGSTRPGAVSIRDAGPLAVPTQPSRLPGSMPLARPGMQRGVPPAPPTPRGLPEPPARGLPEPSGLKPQPDVPPPIPPEVTGPFVNRQLPEPTAIIPPNQTTRGPGLPDFPRGLSRSELPTGETTAAPFQRTSPPPRSEMAKRLQSDAPSDLIGEVMPTSATEIRPEGWGSANDVPSSWTRPDHAYRGMTKTEYEATIGAGRGVRSRGDFSVENEGTSFARNAADAESYVNFGRTDPRKTGEPTYLVEVGSSEGLVASPDGYLKAPGEIPPGGVTRVWEMTADGDRIVARELPTPFPAEAPKPEVPDAEPMGQPPPRPSSPFRSGKGMGRNKGEKGEARVPDPYKAMEELYDTVNELLGKVTGGVGRAAKPLADIPFLPGGSKSRGEKLSLADAFLPLQKRIGDDFLDLTRVNRGAKGWGTYSGQKAVRDLRDAFKDADPADINEFAEWAESRRANFPEGLSEQRDLLEGVSNFVGKITDMQVELDMLPAETAAQAKRYLPRIFAEYARTVNRRGGKAPRFDENFLKRSGEIVIFKELPFEGMEELAKSIDPNARISRKGKRVGVKFPEFDPEGYPNNDMIANFEAFMEAARERIKSDGRKPGDLIAETRSHIPKEYLDEHPQIPVEERFGHAITRGLHRIADGIMLREIAKNPEWVSESPKDGFTTDPMDNRRLGLVRGKYVRNDVAEYLRDLADPKAYDSMADGLLQSLKENLTIYNPAGIARQYHAMPQFFALLGVHNPFRPQFIRTFHKAIRATIEGTPEFEQAMKNDITSAITLPDVELGGTSQKSGMFKKGYAVLGPWKNTKAGRRLKGILGNEYGRADRIVRALGWFHARDNLGMSPREAREYVNKFTQNYDELGPFPDWLRRSPVGSPFGAFQFEKFRNLGNAAQERPLDALQALAWRYKVAAALAALAATGAISAATDDEEEAIRLNKGSQKIPFYRDDQGRMVMLDTRYSDLWGDFVRRVQPIGKGWMGFIDWAAENTGFDVNPLVNTLSTIARGEDKWGRKIYDDYDTDLAKVGKSVLHVVESSYPSLTPVGYDTEKGKIRPSGWAAREIQSSITGEPHDENVPVKTVSQAFLAALVGLKMEPLDVARELDRLNRQRLRSMRLPNRQAREQAKKDIAAYEDREISYEDLLRRNEITNDELAAKFGEYVGEWVLNAQGQMELQGGEYAKRTQALRRLSQEPAYSDRPIGWEERNTKGGAR